VKFVTMKYRPQLPL